MVHPRSWYIVSMRSYKQGVPAVSGSHPLSLLSSWPGASLRTLRLLALIRLSAASPCQLLLVAVRVGFDDEAFAGSVAFSDVAAVSSASVDFSPCLRFLLDFFFGAASSSCAVTRLRFEELAFATSPACSSAYDLTCVRTRPERLGSCTDILSNVWKIGNGKKV